MASDMLTANEWATLKLWMIEAELKAHYTPWSADEWLWHWASADRSYATIIEMAEQWRDVGGIPDNATGSAAPQASAAFGDGIGGSAPGPAASASTGPAASTSLLAGAQPPDPWECRGWIDLASDNHLVFDFSSGDWLLWRFVQWL